MPVVELPGGGEIEFPEGTPPDQMKVAIEKARSRGLIKLPVDNRSGAPAGVRAMVGGRDSPEDRLATLRQYYPSATPDPVDPQNFIYTDPQTGQRKLYNPKGLDPGDVASIAREGLQTVGSIAGAGAGAPMGLAGAAAGSALGGAAGEELYQVGSRLLGAQDTRTTGERAFDTALIGAASVGGPGVGATGGAAARAGAKKVLRAGTTPAEVIAAHEDLARFGASPSMAQATKSGALDTIETLVSRTLGGAGRMRAAVERTLGQIEEASLQKVGHVEPETVGRTVIEGIVGTDGYQSRVAAETQKRYNEFWSHLPPDTQVPLANTQQALTELTQKVPELQSWNEILTTPLIAKVAKDTPATVRVEVLKQLRTAIGDKLTGVSLSDDIPRGDLKKLYASLSRDIEAAAMQAGPDAVRAFDDASTYFKTEMNKAEMFLEPLLKNKTPENLFFAIDRGAKLGPTMVRELRQSLKPQEWETVVKAQLRRMGRARSSEQGAEGEAFSLDTFLTNWDKHRQSGALKEMFNSPGLRQLKEDYEALARAATRVRESSQAFKNPPGTAGAISGQTMALMATGGAGAWLYSGLTGSDVTLVYPSMVATAALTANATARLMTNKNFVRWLGASTKVKPQGWGAHIGRLGAVAAMSDPETRRDIKDFMTVLALGDKERTNGIQEVQGQQEGRAR